MGLKLLVTMLAPTKSATMKRTCHRLPQASSSSLNHCTFR